MINQFYDQTHRYDRYKESETCIAGWNQTIQPADSQGTGKENKMEFPFV
ncbi:MAG: hypothetical protein II919_05265 [Lachnospiraceae bacterium]|nr:hypothetical protein [Lachnospiraceae bacterium]